MDQIDIDFNEITDRDNLVVISRVVSLSPIEGKDRIEFCRVLGYTGVVQKGIHKEGDQVVIFKYDSVVPDIPVFEFLGKNKRIKSKKFSTSEGPVYSQVVILPVNELKDYLVNIDLDNNEDIDVTKEIGVIKYIPKETGVTSSFGQLRAKGGFPSHIVSKTDEMNAQSKLSLLDELKGLSYYITEKADGASMTCFIHPESNEFIVCSRNRMIQECDDNAFWYAAKKYNIEKVLRENVTTATQCELVGPKIQGNRLGLTDIEIRGFNAIDITSRSLYQFDDLVSFYKNYNLPIVTIIEQGDSFNYSIDDLIKISSREYLSNPGQQAEGIVIRPMVPVISNALKDWLSFKVINPGY